MADETENHWETEGGAGDWSFTFDVKDASFAWGGFESIQLTMTGRNSESPKNGDEFPLFLTVGKTFEIVDAGKGIAPLPGKSKKLNAQSRYGKFVDSFVTVATPELLKGRDPFKVDCFVGLTLHITKHTREGIVNGEKQNIQTYEVTGVEVPDAKPATKRRAAKKADEPVIGADIDAENRETLTHLSLLPTWEEFVDGAYDEITDLNDYPWSGSVVDNDTLYRILRGDIDLKE